MPTGEPGAVSGPLKAEDNRIFTAKLFDKYVDFIDIYAQITEQEQERLYHNIIQHEETAMLAQYIRNKGMQLFLQLFFCFDV